MLRITRVKNANNENPPEDDAFCSCLRGSNGCLALQTPHSKHQHQQLSPLLYTRIIMLPPLVGGGIKRCFCLTSAAYIGPNSRTERPRKTKIGTEVAHVTRDSDTTFKVKGQGHQATLLTTALMREAGAAVTMRMYWAWETTGTLRLLGGA